MGFCNFMNPKIFKHCLIWLKLAPFGHEKTFLGMVGRYMLNSSHGGCPGARVMTISGSHVGPHIANIGYMKVYEGLQAPGGISSFFS